MSSSSQPTSPPPATVSPPPPPAARTINHNSLQVFHLAHTRATQFQPNRFRLPHSRLTHFQSPHFRQLHFTVPSNTLRIGSRPINMFSRAPPITTVPVSISRPTTTTPLTTVPLSISLPTTTPSITVFSETTLPISVPPSTSLPITIPLSSLPTTTPSITVFSETTLPIAYPPVTSLPITTPPVTSLPTTTPSITVFLETTLPIAYPPVTSLPITTPPVTSLPTTTPSITVFSETTLPISMPSSPARSIELTPVFTIASPPRTVTERILAPPHCSLQPAASIISTISETIPSATHSPHPRSPPPTSQPTTLGGTAFEITSVPRLPTISEIISHPQSLPPTSQPTPLIRTTISSPQRTETIPTATHPPPTSQPTTLMRTTISSPQRAETIPTATHPHQPTTPPTPRFDCRGRKSHVRRFGMHNIFLAIFSLIGLASTGTTFLLFDGHPYWISIVGVAIFTILGWVGYLKRQEELLRVRPEHPIELIWVGLSVLLTIVVGFLMEMYEQNFRAFFLVGVGVWSLTMIAQPVTDYGLMQLFVSVPLSMALFHFKWQFSYWHVLCSILPVVALYFQYFFVRQFNDGNEASSAQGNIV